LTAARRALLIAALCLGAYANALPNGFVYDDWDLVVRNVRLREGGVLDAVRGGYWEGSRGGSFYYRPVVSLSFLVDHRIWGERPLGYHLTNVLLHTACSLLVLALATVWLRSPGAGLAAAALFAVHPVHTQSVAWIAGRTDVLAALFFLAALALHHRAERAAAASRPGALGLRAGAHAATGLALLSKEMAVTFPAALALHGALVGGRRGPEDRRWRIAAAGSAALVAAYLGVRVAVVGTAAGYADDPHAWWQSADGTASRLLAVPRILAFYAERLFFPWRLAFESGIRPEPAPSVLQIALPLAALAAAAAASLILRRREPAALFGAAWFAATILPVANVFPFFESAMEHFAYIPSAGALVAAVAAGRAVLKRPRARAAAAAAAVLLLGARTADRNLDGRDEETVWRVTVRDSPSARAYNNLGLRLLDAGRLQEARAAFQSAVDHEPDLPLSWSNLGVAAASQGRIAEAAALFRRALSIDPRHPDALFNLAMTLERNERGERYGPGYPAEKALAVYGDLLAVHPGHAEGWTNMGVLLERLGRLPEAAAAYERAVAAGPALPEPHAFLASFLWVRGERGRAAALYRRYLALAPDGEYATEARARAAP
jgi:tetratricopeptide (TPR) repeat protein